MAPTYADELHLALLTIQRASILTKSVLRSLKSNVDAETKADDSPVTIADFAAQALIISAIHAAFPNDSFVGEESASALRQNSALCSRVWELVCSIRNPGTESKDPDLAVPSTMDEMLDIIDLGNASDTACGRVWVLDPIDGTATFMKGQQYAVCLALLVDGVQKLGVLGCPNLCLDHETGKVSENDVDTDGIGVVLSAIAGQRTLIRPIVPAGIEEATLVERKRKELGADLTELDFVEVALGSTSLLQSRHAAVAQHVGASWPGTVLWSQQMKYVALTLGATDVMLRIPATKERCTQIWDHAGGQLIFEEVGGVVTDLYGGKIEFGQGRKIRGERNFGMCAAAPEVHGRIMDAIAKVGILPVDRVE